MGPDTTGRDMIRLDSMLLMKNFLRRYFVWRACGHSMLASLRGAHNPWSFHNKPHMRWW